MMERDDHPDECESATLKVQHIRCVGVLDPIQRGLIEATYLISRENKPGNVRLPHCG
jgi:hypothetical protein